MAIRHTSLLPQELPVERVVATIGLISDTHMPERLAALPAEIFTVLEGIDLLIHAGDVGELWVLDRLSVIAPLIAVHGNDDTSDAQRELPFQQVVSIAGQRILLTHGHQPDREKEVAARRGDAWKPKLAQRSAVGKRAGASIMVAGHMHIPFACMHDGVLLINPGAIASGNYISRQLIQTVALLFLRDDGQPFVVHVDLASPLQPYKPPIDWDAGFAVALSTYSASLLDPDLNALWEQVRVLQQEAPEAFHRALLRVAHRCWSDEQTFITKADLLAALRTETRIPPQVQMHFATVLA